LKPLIDISEINYERDDNRILRNVSWRVERGQHWAILGPNGCGKTTLLKLLAGYEWPTRGRISVLGETYGQIDLRDHRRHIGWVSSAMSERHRAHTTSEDVVVSGIDASLGIWREFTPEERADARANLGRLRAAHLAQRRWGVLSQGERQRTLIARALIARPALLVLDEPCAGLDPVARADFLVDLAHLAASPDAPGIVMVTHHVEELGAWLTHGLFISRGEVLASGPLADQMTTPMLARLFERDVRLSGSPGDWRLNV